MSASAEAVISIRDLTVGFGDVTILKELSLDVFRGEILGVVGGSGAGKSVLMRTIIGLLPKQGGSIEVFGTDQDRASRRRVPRHPAALGHTFPARRAVLVADRAPERAVPYAGISQTARTAHGRDRHRQA